MTAAAGSGEFLMIVPSFHRSDCCSVGGVGSIGSVSMQDSCACDHGNQSHAGDGMRAEWLLMK